MLTAGKLVHLRFVALGAVQGGGVAGGWGGGARTQKIVPLTLFHVVAGEAIYPLFGVLAVRPGYDQVGRLIGVLVTTDALLGLLADDHLRRRVGLVFGYLSKLDDQQRHDKDDGQHDNQDPLDGQTHRPTSLPLVCVSLRF
jgi:hypothetical protein